MEVFMTWLLAVRKEHQYPQITRLGESQSWARHFGEEENLLPLQEFEPQIVQLAA